MSRSEAFTYHMADPTPPSEQLHQAHQPPKGHGEQLSLFTPKDTGSELERMHGEYHGGAMALDSQQWLHGTQATSAAGIMRHGLQSNPGMYGEGGYLTQRVDTAHGFSSWNGGRDDNRVVIRGSINARNPVHMNEEQFAKLGREHVSEEQKNPRYAANEELRRRGHDVVFLHNIGFGASQPENWAIALHPGVFRPHQALDVEQGKKYWGPGHPESRPSSATDTTRTDHFYRGADEHFQTIIPALATGDEHQKFQQWQAQRKADEDHRKRQEELAKLDFI